MPTIDRSHHRREILINVELLIIRWGENVAKANETGCMPDVIVRLEAEGVTRFAEAVREYLHAESVEDALNAKRAQLLGER